MCDSVRRDFGGIGMGCHRVDLIKQLDQVLGLGYLQQYSPDIDGRSVEFSKNRYGEFKRLLLELEERTSRIPTRTPSRLIGHIDFLT